MNNISKYKIIEDISKLEIPEYIDKPEYVKHKSVGYSLMFAGWLIWFWLLIPLFTLFLWWFEGKTIYQQIVVQAGPYSELSLINMVVMIIIFISCLFIWATYNWVRFYGNDRRTAPPEVTDQQMANSFDLRVNDLQNLHKAKNITLFYNTHGKLEHFDIHA
ncbi:poly-beta-1,6-N-acetyl-D-glucosamine biosynthesis protein PgaD [Acinetobacter stercoris]|uniref:Poly-beta-1,6-N-acetyl-D-glucosamine biosynthesis protein PgaD n=1 Tax=Acinetobacter stercoris TaxID=2126983 RepID=A0A2U3N330_9GAMM|nr:MULTISPECIES: poly-beta-1,6-N-acetyl-D-glucosamine biosynthesis protein PgaD [Acinetobacter]SPL72024.1 hypothetical protein KPC_3202 [Acinetobacter stercoris]